MNSYTSFTEAVEPIMYQFAKRRISAFAKRNKVSIDDVEVVNEIPIEQLEKEFKRSNNIKTRLYKNMNEEQQKAWEIYYNDHKQLSLRVKESHDKVVVAEAEQPDVKTEPSSQSSHKHTRKPKQQQPTADGNDNSPTVEHEVEHELKPSSTTTTKRRATHKKEDKVEQVVEDKQDKPKRKRHSSKNNEIQ